MYLLTHLFCILFEFLQSLDYDVCENSLFQKEQQLTNNARFSIRKDVLRWIIFIQIGIITALIACAIDIVIEELSAIKYAFLKHCKYIQSFNNEFTHQDVCTVFLLH